MSSDFGLPTFKNHFNSIRGRTNGFSFRCSEFNRTINQLNVAELRSNLKYKISFEQLQMTDCSLVIGICLK